MKTWIDNNTGRRIRQLTDFPDGASVPYFRCPRNLPDGRIVISGKHETGHQFALDVASGDLQPIQQGRGSLIRWREHDGQAWYFDNETREVLQRGILGDDLQVVGRLDPEVPGNVEDITCDGRTLIGAIYDSEAMEGGLTSDDYRVFWRFIYRRRRGSIWTYDLIENRYAVVLEMTDYAPTHIDASPVDPGLFKFAQDGVAIFEQRAFAMRTDGTAYRKIRPQECGEWVHHEFWWPGAQFIAYKYLDRRQDTTTHLRPWGEYAPVPLHLGIADLSGREVYCSDPLDHYQSHLNVSPDGRYITGEGTHNHSFVSVAPFDMASTKVTFQALATIHTPYVPAAGQVVECGVTMDGRWVPYNDQIDGRRQVCAVELSM
ncbi:MAG: hypothetical protein ACYDCO_05585 [Armatimonadota bacterium]